MAKKSKELTIVASKKVDQIKIKALKCADQIKTLAGEIEIPIPISPIKHLASQEPATEESTMDELESFGVTDELREFVKGITISTFQDFPMEDSEHPILESSKLYEDISDEVFESNTASDHQICQLYFNSASRRSHKEAIVAGVGVVLIDPLGHVLLWAYSLTEPCSNNVVEYKTLVIGLQLGQDMGIKYLKAHSDSKLIVNKIKGEYKVRHNDLIPYYKVAIKLAYSFEGFYIS